MIMKKTIPVFAILLFVLQIFLSATAYAGTEYADYQKGEALYYPILDIYSEAYNNWTYEGFKNLPADDASAKGYKRNNRHDYKLWRASHMYTYGIIPTLSIKYDEVFKPTYCFMDLNDDGTPELLIGSDGENASYYPNSFIEAVYTIVNGKIIYVASADGIGEVDLLEKGYLFSEVNGGTVVCWQSLNLLDNGQLTKLANCNVLAKGSTPFVERGEDENTGREYFAGSYTKGGNKTFKYYFCPVIYKPISEYTQRAKPSVLPDVTKIPETNSGNNKPSDVKGVTISLNKKSAVLKEMQTLQLKSTIIDLASNNRTLKWLSNNKRIAEVNQKGLVTAKKTGTCVITCQSADGLLKATCKITVKKRRKVKSVHLNKKSIKLNEGKTYTLKARVLPKKATVKTVYWKSSDAKIVTVTDKGKLTALKKGQATITVITKDGKKKAKCKVIVG